MADEEKVTTEEQALADEWAAALAEAGDASQDDIDALMAQGGATPVAEPSTPRAPMEEFGASPKAPTISGLEGPNLDVILDIPVTISMEVGHTDIILSSGKARKRGNMSLPPSTSGISEAPIKPNSSNQPRLMPRGPGRGGAPASRSWSTAGAPRTAGCAGYAASIRGKSDGACRPDGVRDGSPALRARPGGAAR